VEDTVTQAQLQRNHKGYKRAFIELLMNNKIYEVGQTVDYDFA
jgi:hypothetical protein